MRRVPITDRMIAILSTRICQGVMMHFFTSNFSFYPAKRVHKTQESENSRFTSYFSGFIRTPLIKHTSTGYMQSTLNTVWLPLFIFIFSWRPRIKLYPYFFYEPKYITKPHFCGTARNRSVATPGLIGLLVRSGVGGHNHFIVVGFK